MTPVPANRKMHAASFTTMHSLVSGHGFSRAENDPKMIRGFSPCKTSFTITSAPFPVNTRPTLASHIQKIPDHLVPTLGQHALRMKLHALNLQRPVPQPHDRRSRAIRRPTPSLCPRRHLQLLRQRPL